ncbi:MAG: GTP 3',8-cyclase MoaA [Flavobacteriales bacterium]|nr:GTP 3',8-cyclase MoaA [Flavobacteriales bacterium]
MLSDKHGRTISYLRLAVTDRCNLRCYYCMPECGIDFVQRKELLSYEEMLRLAQIHADMGVNKVRITGGEPFVRKDLLPFINRLSAIPGIDEVHVTTNGTVSAGMVSQFKEAGISGINLSLDTLRKDRFFEITRRDQFDEVMRTFHQLLECGIPVKINMVLMNGVNDDELVDMALLARDYPVDVRFLEEMPFNGNGAGNKHLLSARMIEERLHQAFEGITKLHSPHHETATRFSVPEFKGNVGIIPSFTRTICGGCNRIRVTPTGQLKTCLYDNGVLDLKALLRGTADDSFIAQTIRSAVDKKPKDGFEAERQIQESSNRESMATIGG